MYLWVKKRICKGFIYSQSHNGPRYDLDNEFVLRLSIAPNAEEYMDKRYQDEGYAGEADHTTTLVSVFFLSI